MLTDIPAYMISLFSTCSLDLATTDTRFNVSRTMLTYHFHNDALLISHNVKRWLDT